MLDAIVASMQVPPSRRTQGKTSGRFHEEFVLSSGETVRFALKSTAYASPFISATAGVSTLLRRTESI